ncbi:hypothetical protein CHELA17_65589 [Chelatococcus asaccharovorans]|nr:hypothetical protein CHELA17_65589 [Chelatococcus asaccharovorans]
MAGLVPAIPMYRGHLSDRDHRNSAVAEFDINSRNRVNPISGTSPVMTAIKLSANIECRFSLGLHGYRPRGKHAANLSMPPLFS